MHCLWAATQPEPTETDAQYYLTVARNIAEGRGAVSRSLWNLSYLPPSLPMPADLHWMPLPSRVLVPFAWLGLDERAAGVSLAALWGPLGWALARRLDAGRPELAGILAISGGIYARLLSSPDCYALYGLLGGLGLLAAAEKRPWLAVSVGALAALTRNDGLLLSPCLALAFGGAARWLIFASGPAAYAAWTWRNLQIGGEAWWESRRRLGAAPDYVALFDGADRGALDLLGRLGRLAEALPDLVGYLLTPTLLLLLLPASYGLWLRRDRGLVRSLLAYVLLSPPLTVLAAPVIALHGTLDRSGTATFCAQMALAVVGLEALAEILLRARGYPRAFTAGVLSVGFVAASIGQGLKQASLPERPSECPLVAGLPPGQPVFTSRPLEMELSCGRPGVMITRALPPERASLVAERYGVRVAVACEPGFLDEGSLTIEAASEVLPGWLPLGEQVYRAP